LATQSCWLRSLLLALQLLLLRPLLHPLLRKAQLLLPLWLPLQSLLQLLRLWLLRQQRSLLQPLLPFPLLALQSRQRLQWTLSC
jgi:hypothetical protein